MDSLARQQQVQAPWHDPIALLSLQPKCQPGPRRETVPGSHSQGRTGYLHQMRGCHSEVGSATPFLGCFAVLRGLVPRKVLLKQCNSLCKAT